MKELNPHFMASFQKTQTYLQESAAMVEDASIMVYQQVVRQEEDQMYFNLSQLKRLPNYKSYLYQWLHEFGFSAWDDVYDLADSQSGKQIFSREFRLLKDRDFLILSPIILEFDQQEYFIEKDAQDVKIPLNLSFCKVDDISVSSNTAIFVDEDALEFPLVLRKWKEGDNFQPLGMDGKTKKLSKFFKDEKFSLFDKQNCWILCSGEFIVWIVGHRQDERFKVNSATKQILKIDLL